MSQLMERPPFSAVEPVTEILHGVPVSDPYRWLEDQASQRTRAWIEDQTRYARAYLDGVPNREQIRERVREFLSVETYDSFLQQGDRYIFRKRLPGQEQACIYMRVSFDSPDRLLLDPSSRGTGTFTSIKPVCVSSDCRLLLYEVKHGGERSGTFELFDIDAHCVLPDSLPHGYLRGFAFDPGGRSFYYVHEPLDGPVSVSHSAYKHVIGSSPKEDEAVFFEASAQMLRLTLVTDGVRLGFLVLELGRKPLTTFYLGSFSMAGSQETILKAADYLFAPRFSQNRILAMTDRNAPNRRIVQLKIRRNREPEFVDIVPEQEFPIRRWLVAGDRLFVSYIRGTRTVLRIFTLEGETLGEVPIQQDESVRLLTSATNSQDVLLETESFTEPPSIFRFVPSSGKRVLWAKRAVPFRAEPYAHKQIWFSSADGTLVPMFLFGRREALDGGCHRAIMTSYGGHGLSMTPQFTVLVSFLVERGVLFAVPSIRGGSEFGAQWHEAAKRHNRQTAYNDFLAAAEWMIKAGRTTAVQLGIFGGSNSGLLVAAAMTQRPDLFRAVLCMVPILDMLRYHLFDHADLWKEEFGTSEEPEDFAALYAYSPYHHIRPSTAYPATLIVSGDADQNCNPLHARKFTAKLQAANTSPFPVILDYSRHRGHSPVLPLTERINALTDRLAFLCDQLQVPL
jgi:prolyl oligopeptidase